MWLPSDKFVIERLKYICSKILDFYRSKLILRKSLDF